MSQACFSFLGCFESLFLVSTILGTTSNVLGTNIEESMFSCNEFPSQIEHSNRTVNEFPSLNHLSQKHNSRTFKKLTIHNEQPTVLPPNVPVSYLFYHFLFCVLFVYFSFTMKFRMRCTDKKRNLIFTFFFLLLVLILPHYYIGCFSVSNPIEDVVVYFNSSFEKVLERDIFSSDVSGEDISVSISGIPSWMNEESISDLGGLFLVGSLDTNYARGVFVSENYAYIADDDDGLKIIDITNKETPVLVGSLDTSGAYGVFVSENYAYIADHFSGLKIIDITNKETPVLVGSLDTSGYAFGVFVSENYAYIADGVSRLKIIDITNKETPVFVGSLDTSSIAYGVFVSENYTYIADGYSGLKIIDITNKETPVLVGSLDTSRAYGVFVSENYTYIADSYSGLKIIDISNKETPVLVGSLGTRDANSVFVSENYAYIADDDYGLKMVDITNKETPVLVGSLDTYYARDVFVSENYAYVADLDEGLKIIGLYKFEQITLSGICTEIGSSIIQVFATDTVDSAFDSFTVTCECSNEWEGDDCSVCPIGCNVNGTVEDDCSGCICSDHWTDTYCTTCSNSWSGDDCLTCSLNCNHGTNNENCTGCVCLGNWEDTDCSYCYLSCASDSPLDEECNFCTLKSEPTIEIDIPDQTVQFSSSFSYTISRDHFSSDHSIEISVNGHPSWMFENTSWIESEIILLSIHDSEDAQDVFVTNDLAFIADSSFGLKIFNFTQKNSPFLVGSFETTGSSVGVFVLGNYSYIADGSEGMKIIDISNPVLPSLVSSFDTTDAQSVVISDDEYAFIADGSSGLKIVNLENIESPVLVGGLGTSSSYKDIFLVGNYVFVAEDTSGLQIVDVTVRDAANPLGSLDTSGNAVGIFVLDDFAYIADSGSGLIIVDVSDKNSPSLIGSYDTAIDSTTDVFVSGNYAYLADGSEGLVVVDVTNKADPILVFSFNDFTSDCVSVFVDENDVAYSSISGGGVAAIELLFFEETTLSGICNVSGNSSLEVFVSDVGGGGCVSEFFNISCECSNFWIGDDCSICPISCSNEGTSNPDCTGCNCTNLWDGSSCDECTLVCDNDGTYNSDCNGCDCVNSWTEFTCNTCPLTCNNEGTTNSNCTGCDCANYWSGSSCDTCPLACDNDGSTNSDCTGCDCTNSWTGSLCDTCPLTCYNEGSSNSECNGCDCVNSWTEFTCDTCPLICNNGGTYNSNCTGCDCSNNWTGDTCTICLITSCENEGILNETDCSCECTNYWSGFACDTCPLDCNNDGEVISDCIGCDCKNSWSGESCDICPLTCNNEGSTNSNCTGCDCTNSWSGDFCDTCALTCNNGGSTNSDCTGCECVDNWGGSNCNYCVGGWVGYSCSICELDCENGEYNTLCTDCECEGGWTRDTCSTCDLVCGNNGEHSSDCTSCDCDSLWEGESCSTCSLGVLDCQTEKSDGINYTLCNCICKEGYFGYSCEYYTCFGIEETDYDNVCSGKGNCVAPDVCLCRDDYENEFTDGPCTTWSCQKIYFDSSDESLCNGHGECIEPDTCDCEIGYAGEFCDTWNCGAYSMDSEFRCNEKGTCISPNYCECDDSEDDDYYGHFGDLCELKFGKNLVLATKNMLIVYFETKTEYLSNYELPNIDNEDEKDILFLCSNILQISETQQEQPYQSDLLSDLFVNCTLSQKNDFLDYFGSTLYLKIDLRHISTEQLVKIMDVYESKLNVLVHNNEFTVNLISNGFGEDISSSSEYYTMKTYSSSSVEEDSSDELDSIPKEDTEVCKLRLHIDDQCIQPYECVEQLFDDSSSITTEYFSHYSVGFSPSTTSSDLFFTKIYFQSREQCEEGIEFDEIKKFSLVSCNGGDFGDNFSMYRYCSTQIADIFFGSQVLTIFFVTTSPIYILIIFGICFGFYCGLNCCIYFSKSCCLKCYFLCSFPCFLLTRCFPNTRMMGRNLDDSGDDKKINLKKNDEGCTDLEIEENKDQHDQKEEKEEDVDSESSESHSSIAPKEKYFGLQNFFPKLFLLEKSKICCCSDCCLCRYILSFISFCCCVCHKCCRPLREFIKCCLIFTSILIKEGFSLWFASNAFLDDADVDTQNPNYVLVVSIMGLFQYIIWISIGIYLLTLFIFILFHVRYFLFDPLMFSIGYGSLKELFYYRVFKAAFLLWFICINMFCYVTKFIYLDDLEKEIQLTNINFWLGIIIPEFLLLFCLFDVLAYNGVSSHAHLKRLKKLKLKGWIKFPKIKIGFSKCFKDVDVILEEFFQILYLLDKRDSDRGKDVLKKLKTSDEYGHLSWEYIDGLDFRDIVFLKEFFFPISEGHSLVVKKEDFLVIFHHHRILSKKWILTFIFFPILCIFGMKK